MYNKHLIYKMEATKIYREQTSQVYEHLIDDTDVPVSLSVWICNLSARATKHTMTWEEC